MRPSLFIGLARLTRRIAFALCALTVLGSCGGVDSGGTGAPTESLASGPVSGLGSVIVNGVRFDDSTAVIVDQDGNPLNADQLQVGMTIRIDAAAVGSANGVQTASALTIRRVSEIVGPVDSISVAGMAITVLGQSVRVTAATWFDPSLIGGVSVLAAGQVVEVWAQYNARTNEYVATRIAPHGNSTSFELRGPLTSIGPAPGNFTVGGLTISAASIAAGSLPVLNLGDFVRVSLAITPVNGVWTASGVTPGNTPLPDRSDVRLAGRISSFTSVAQFVVNGQTVDASGAVFSGGAAGVTLGARVAAVGSSSHGVLEAAVVTLLGDETLANSPFELHGAITSLNAAVGTLEVRGVTINYSSASRVFRRQHRGLGFGALNRPRRHVGKQQDEHRCTDNCLSIKLSPAHFGAIGDNPTSIACL